MKNGMERICSRNMYVNIPRFLEYICNEPSITMVQFHANLVSLCSSEDSIQHMKFFLSPLERE